MGIGGFKLGRDLGRRGHGRIATGMRLFSRQLSLGPRNSEIDSKTSMGLIANCLRAQHTVLHFVVAENAVPTGGMSPAGWGLGKGKGGLVVFLG
jgi:hypothetical protein